MAILKYRATNGDFVDLIDTNINDTIKNQIKNVYMFNYNDTVNVQNLKTNDILSMYDTLMAKYPGNIFKTDLGKNYSQTHNVYMYHLKPCVVKESVFNATNGTFDIKNNNVNIKTKKIILTSAIHGDEKSTAFALYKFIEDIYENWSDSFLLEYLRFNVEFIILPVLNPSGYDLNSRYAVNPENTWSKDLNREFPASDDNIPENSNDAGNNGGLEAPESQYISTIIKNNLDCDFMIDIHNMQPQKGYFLSWNISDDFRTTAIINKTLSKLSPNWQKKYTFLEQDKGMIFGTCSNFKNSDGVTESCTLSRYAVRRGVKAMTLEMPTAILYTGYNTPYSKQQINLHIELIANTIINSIM